ncbi:MAG: hypothetical protein AAF467_20610 [Actinomycetota bacterium]
MTPNTSEQVNGSTSEPLSDVWDTSGDAALDEDCSPTKVCRNARDFTFDGIAEGEDDLATSWRKLLAREGKLSTEGGSVRDLVLGTPSD